LQRVICVFAVIATIVHLSWTVEAGDLSPAELFTIQDANRFEGWYAGASWSNPFNTFRADHGTTPLSSATLTGSLFGIAGGRSFQRGALYAGFSGSLVGGVVEGQAQTLSCPANCYTSLNALGEVTFSIGLIFWQRFLLYSGGGANFAIMQSGQTLHGLHEQVVSGEHGTFGAKYAIDDRWTASAQVERVRVGDLYYTIPNGFVGVNPHDFWMGTLGFEYRFDTSSP
jgi:hypothetical protein